MRKTLALLALAGLMALMSVALGSPPTQKEKVQKAEYSETVTTATADASAVATRDAEARTREAADAGTVNGTLAEVPAATVAAVRRDVNPPERLHSGFAGTRGKMADYRYDHGAIGYARRV